ncbi:hypothetical protein EPH_0075780 [Eimeria praecox]|uniref:DNA 3'-5' helicase n=1 Tax=Eimeria praecox TaxID=51316 RepID=U6H604_9EIME|nr:hypothetical protein EPH_0075780 [Eimeria praecox]
MSQPLPKPQQHHTSSAAAGRAAPEQATRWLLGRIKDGSQKALLLQQAPSIARSLPWAPSVHSQGPVGPTAPAGSYPKTSSPLWPHQHSQALRQPAPGHPGLYKGQQQHHNQSNVRSTHDSLAPCGGPHFTHLSAANKSHLRAACSQRTDIQEPDRHPHIRSPSGGPRPSGPLKASQGGFCMPNGTERSTSAHNEDLLNSRPQPKRPWDSNCLGKQSTGTGKQARLVLRTALPIHWQQQQTQQQRQYEQQVQQHRQNEKQQQEHKAQQQEQQQRREQQDHYQQEQHQAQLHRQYREHQQDQQQHQPREQQDNVDRQSPPVNCPQIAEPHQSEACRAFPVACADLNPGKHSHVATSSSSSGNSLGSSSHATAASGQGAVCQHSSMAPQPKKEGLAISSTNLRESWGPAPVQSRDASLVNPGYPLRQQRSASDGPGGPVSDCCAPFFPHPEVLYRPAVAAQTKTKEETLYKSNSTSNSLPPLPQHGALFGTLSPEQTKVVNAPPHSSVCVLAGPGAGKTSTITARIVGLLLQGCRPLAALTFTKKSATELERRVRGGLEGVLKDRRASACISKSNADASGIDERDLFVGTFHSFFVRLLKSYGGYVGVPPNFRVLNQFQQLSILRSLIETEKRAEALRLGNSGARGISAALRSSAGVPELSSEEDDGCSEEEGEAQGLGGQGFDSGAFNSSTSKEAEELRKRIRSMKFIPELLERERASGSVLFRLFCQYDKHLRAQQPPLLDFTDLTVKALRLLEPPAMRAELGSQWPYLVVDEFQDTNSNQFKFICLLALQKPPSTQTSYTELGAPALSNPLLRRGGVTVVGDDDQSIYKWRGTHTGIFHEFKRNFPDYQEFFLACNYRSVPAVVRHSLSLVNFNWPFRISKALYSSHESPGDDRLPCSCSSQGKARKDTVAEREGLAIRDTGIQDSKGLAEGHVHGAFLPSQALEAQYILRYILCLKQHHSLRWDDFAVLCRTNSALLDIQNLLMNPRIQRAACSASSPFSTNSVHGNSENGRDDLGSRDPNRPADPAVLFPALDLADLELPVGGLPLSSTSSKRSGGAEVFLRPDVLDLLAYLRLAVDPHHDASFIRVLNRPPRRVGAKTLLALKRVQNASASNSAKEIENSSAIVEMPWQGIPWAPGDQKSPREAPFSRASLFDALCRVLHCAGMLGETPELPPEGPADAVAATEAARLRMNQVESLSSFAKIIYRLRSMSGLAVSVKAVVELLLGPLGMGEFFAHRRLVQRSRRGGVPDSEAGTGTAESAIPQLQDLGAPAAAPAAGTKPRRSKRKATTEDDVQPFGDLKEADTHTEASLRELSKLYGSEMFADVLGLLRALEAYSPNWQQATAADCILRLLRDADSGRFLQQKITNAVTLSTIHQAKGLEWQVVIVARANEGTLPMGLGGSQPLADFVGRLISSFAEKPPKPETLRQAEATIVRQASGNEQHFHLMEERRVCYVAMTRARRFLLLTAPLADKANHPLNPSRFFKEAGLVSQRQPQLPALAVATRATTKPDESQGAQVPK